MMSHIEMEYAKTLKQVSQLERELVEAREQLRLCNVDQFTTAAELAEAVEKERERCAKVCEERGSFTSMYAHHILTGAAAAIRKGEKESLTVEARKPVPEFELIEKWEGE